jgi:hypothetical protein
MIVTICREGLSTGAGTRFQTDGYPWIGLKGPGKGPECHRRIFQMSRRNFKFSTGRNVVWATVAVMALALTMAGPSFAGSSVPAPKKISATGSSGVTDFSAARRHRHRHHRRHYGRGDAAAAAAFAGIMGTVGAIAASQARRDAYYDYGPGYYGPGYYGPPRGYYYGGPRYYVPY